MSETTKPIPEIPKPTPETFQWLVRYSDMTHDKKIDLNVLAKAMGTKYKAAWDGINRAKKDLATAGYVTPDLDAAVAVDTPKKQSTPKGNSNGGSVSGGKKRKVKEEDGGNTETIDTPTPAEKKKRVGSAKKEVKDESKVKSEDQDDDDG